MSIVQYKKIGSLSLLKFFLAFITFLFHMYIHFSVVYKAKLINKFICDGAFAMSGFFILSGFLLYYIYSQKSFSDFEYMKNFYIKRLIKVLPSAYFVTIIMYLFSRLVLHTSVNWTILIMQFIPMQAFFPHLFGKFLNGGMWFVSVLLFLYFLFPLLCFVVKSIKHIYLFAITVYLLGIFPLMVNCYYPTFSLYHLPSFRICEFIMGMITAKILLLTKNNIKNAELFVFLTSLAIFFGISLLHSNNFFNHVSFCLSYMNYDLILLILFPMLIYFLSVAKNKYFLLIMQSKVIDYLGKISYAFFITQMISFFIVSNYFKPNNYFGLSSTAILFVSFVLNMVFAILMYEIFEKNLSNWLIGKFIRTCSSSDR